jgi:hypothetical protein
VRDAVHAVTALGWRFAGKPPRRKQAAAQAHTASTLTPLLRTVSRSPPLSAGGLLFSPAPAPGGLAASTHPRTVHRQAPTDLRELTNMPPMRTPAHRASPRNCQVSVGALFPLLVLGLLLVSLLPSLSCAAAGTSDVLFGQSAVQSGDSASLGLAMRRGIAMAMRRANERGGIHVRIHKNQQSTDAEPMYATMWRLRFTIALNLTESAHCVFCCARDFPLLFVLSGCSAAQCDVAFA